MDDEKSNRRSFHISNPFSSSSHSAGRNSPQPPPSPRPVSADAKPLPPSPVPAPTAPPRSPNNSHLNIPPHQYQQQTQTPPPYDARAAAATTVTTSRPLPPTPAFKTYFACLTLNMTDRIRLINFRPEDFQVVQNVVRGWWPEGIQSMRPYGLSQEIKCGGYPWSRSAHGNDNSRRLVVKILNALYDQGWVLQTAIDISRKEWDKDSLIFRYQSPPPPPCEWIAISFDWHDKLKIVGDTPPDLAQALVASYATLVASHELRGDGLKIHFKGSPWWPSGEGTVLTRQMLLTLCECLERFGFSVYTSLDMSNSSEGRECDVMIANRQRDWVPGQPIWHR